MSVQPRVVVIGGGVIGASCLYHLVQRGLTDVTLVEKDALCSGSSGRSAAMVETQYVNELDILLRARSMPLFDHLAATADMPFVRHGYMRLGWSEADLEAFRRSQAYQRELGITHPRVLDRAGAAQEIPGLKVDDVAGALYGPEDGYIDPHIYVHILAEQAKERGAKVHTFTPVTGIRVEKGKVRAVETSRGTLPADIVVNAAGAWAKRIGEMVGVPFPVEGYRRQIGVFQPARDPGKVPFVMEYVPGADREGVYFRDETGGRILAGLHSEDHAGGEEPVDPDSYAEKADWAYMERLIDLLSQRYAPAADFGIQTGWAGLYPITPDTEPIIGEVPGVAGLINCIGFGGVGVQLSPIAGQIVAELVVDGRVTAVPDMSVFSLGRFL